MKILKILIILPFVFLICCKNKKRLDTLNIRLKAEPVTLDWNKATDTSSRTIIFNIMDPLLDLEFSKNGVKASPSLLESWDVSENGKTYTFKLREKVKWSDDKELVSQHIYDSFKRFLSPETAAFNSFLFYVINGARSYNTGKAKDFNSVGIKVVSPYKIKFQLTDKFSPFPKLLALFSVLPIREDLIKKYGENQWASAENLVTLGPYRLKKSSTTSRYKLTANSNYWGKPPKYKSVNFLVIEEDTTALSLFDAKNIDLLEGIPSDLLLKLKEKPEYRLAQNLAIEYLGFNTTLKPFDNPDYRKALSCAINYNDLKKLLTGNEELNKMFLPNGIEGHVKDYKWTCGNFDSLKGPKKIHLTYYTNKNQKKLMEYFQHQLKKQMQWDVELHNQEWKTYIARVNSNPPAVYRLGWLAIFPDPTLFLSLFTSDSHFNTSGWSNGKYDQLYKKIISLPNSKERKDLILEANNILVKEHRVVIPLYNGVRHYLVSDKLAHIKFNPLNRIFIKKF